MKGGDDVTDETLPLLQPSDRGQCQSLLFLRFRHGAETTNSDRRLFSLDYLLLFLTVQAFIISVFRTMRRTGRGFLAMWELDAKEEELKWQDRPQPTRCGDFNV